MAIHSEKKEHLRRRRESLGHIKLHLDDLSALVDEWERWCGSVTISVGDGVNADFVEDLVDATKFEMSHLSILTENPTVTIALRRHKAELSYIANPADAAIIDNIRSSLTPFKLLTPFYRLRSFWWLLYLIIASTTVLVVGQHNNWKTPLWPLFLPFGAMAILVCWFIYSFSRMRRRSSARVLRGKKISPNWRKAKALAYWIFPPIALAIGIILGKALSKK